MINIEIKPAVGQDGGWYRATGHAAKGHEAVCEAVTVIANCLAANLQNTWDVRSDGTAEDGRCSIWWARSDRKGRGLARANLAAGFAYTGLRALAREYPEDVTVKWIRTSGIPQNKKEEKK